LIIYSSLGTQSDPAGNRANAARNRLPELDRLRDTLRARCQVWTSRFCRARLFDMECFKRHVKT